MRRNNIDSNTSEDATTGIHKPNGLSGSRVLFEDNHLIIISKLASEIVQGDKTGDSPLSETVKSYIKENYNKPGRVFLGVVHRIDRPVSGAIIFARTSKALTRMNEMLKNKTITKKYLAVVAVSPPASSGKLVHYLRKNEKQNKSYVVHESTRGAKRAELLYNVIAGSDRYFLLEVELLTGRHHQVRAQLAAIGSPIKGDLKYGYDRSNPGGSIHLHARSVSFTHPVRDETVHVVAPLPAGDPIWQLFETYLK